MPRPFSFAASFISQATPSASPARDTTSSRDAPADGAKVPCAPLSIKLPRPLPPKRGASPPRVRASQCATVLGASCTCAQPEELLVLAHGLQGAVADFSYLLDMLDATAPARSGHLLVHASAVNTDRTHDGVEAGGERLAADVRAIASQHPSLRCVSLVGFSLGGLYVRYAAAALFDPATRTIAGLRPARFVAVASPHLGVRAFGVYRFLPAPVRARANLVCGATGLELFLEDSAPLLMRMASDEGLPFLSALRAFESRVLYANTKNDFMVNYGTAALDENVTELSASDLAPVLASPRGSDATDVDRAHDDRGCKVCFTFRYETKEESSPRAPVTSGEEEAEMARRLRDVGWTVVAVEFPVALPIAHNRIVAMSRGPIHTWLNAAGRRVVHHLVDTLVDGFEDITPTFQAVQQEAPRKSLSLRGFVSDS